MSDVAAAGIPQQRLGPFAVERTGPQQEFAAEIVEGGAAYEALRAEWRRLAALQQGSILFQTPELLAVWGRHFADAGRLATIVVRHNQRAVLIWPLLVERRGLIRVAQGAGAPISQYDDVLLDPDCDADAALEVALAAIAENLGPDLIMLERVRADSALRGLLGDRTPISWAEAAPYVDLSEGVSAALSKIKPSVARKQRKRVRRFGKSGEVRFEVARTAADAEAWLVEALRLKRAWLKATGRVSRAFVKCASSKCLTELARTLDGSDGSPWMVVSKLSLDGHTTAIEVAICHRGAYHLYLRAFAPEFSGFGPGNVLTERMLGWCAANNLLRYDMLSPRSRNKSEWKSNEVAVLDFALPMTLSGRLYVGIVLKRLQPALRHIFYALPSGIRSAVAGVVLRT
jgi:CelD/BcsL family acetyltransferase involved in cellulose biosynthesis